ncbi:MAG TPA: UvrD-helicase domain-containing protein [Solirubrobacter sp.]|nr:UvrD-helicase domain-containing protein [Solirubrobacter sp.]
MTRPPFTPEQRAAIAARRGSALLAANAGSGKTAVMVERIAAAVREDGVPVGAILALTFTEKAAGELAERLRRRLIELGEDEHARAVDGAWIGTIHGFCARLLRSQPLAAGLDPRFEVLEQAAAERLAGAAYDRALESWARAEGAAAIDLAASYGPALRDLVLAAHATLRARGHAHPRLKIPPAAPPPDPAQLAAARDAALRSLATAGDGARVTAARAALEVCAELLAPAGLRGEAAAAAGGGAANGSAAGGGAASGAAGGAASPRAAVPWPGALGAAELKGGARALSSDTCEAYRDAWCAYRAGCADHHARAALQLIDRLLSRFAGAYADAKRERAAVDFDDLELHARTLLEDATTRQRWAERFELIMVDEFQDTNAVQLGILEALERDNLFAVGDEFQSIYRFRHADVNIFRGRAKALPATAVNTLAVNFRSREELLDVLNAAFAPELGDRFTPLRAGRRDTPEDSDGALRLFALDPPATAPPVELHITPTQNEWDGRQLGLEQGGDQPWRRAEARALAHRLRQEVEDGRRAGDIVVLVRATASLRLLEEALEDQGLPTYVVGGRGYWSQEQVRDGLAWLRVLANPHDEEALLTVLASPFHGATTDELVRLTHEGRQRGGLWVALQQQDTHLARLLREEREHAERAPLEVLLERAIVATGYDLAVLARPGGDRRLANLRKLMRLAGEYERAEGRDLRGFLADAAARDLAEAREGEAALESEGLDAIRLMTIHRAKGLEFPVVAVADLGRQSGARRSPLLIGEDGTAGLRLAPLGGGETIPTPAWERLAQHEAEQDAEEERRLFYVAMTRAKDLLLLFGGTDTARRPAPRPGGPPIDWIAPALANEPAWDGRPARVETQIHETLPDDALQAKPRTRATTATNLPRTPAFVPKAPQRSRPAPNRLSYSQLADYARCGYRFYLRRVLDLADITPPPLPQLEGESITGLDARTRGSIVHAALEDPARPIDALTDEPLTEEQIDDIRRLVAAFNDSPLHARVANAKSVTREAGFAFTLEPDGSGPLIRGFVDVLARETDGTQLVVDYKTDALPDDTAPADYIARHYETQRIVYALATLRAGADRTDVAYALLERPQEPVIMSYTQADAPELAHRLSTLAHGILHHHYPVTDTPHRELCGDCPGRLALCSHPQSRTLRPPPAPWPGVPARHTTPAGTSPAADPPPR